MLSHLASLFAIWPGLLWVVCVPKWTHDDRDKMQFALTTTLQLKLYLHNALSQNAGSPYFELSLIKNLCDLSSIRQNIVSHQTVWCGEVFFALVLLVLHIYIYPMILVYVCILLVNLLWSWSYQSLPLFILSAHDIYAAGQVTLTNGPT